MTIHRACLFGLLFSFGLLPAARGAVPATAPTPAANNLGAGNLLDARYESLTSGISLCPPAKAKVIRGPLGGPEIVRFINEDKDKKWLIKVYRMLLEQDKPLPLSYWRDKSGIEHDGMLQWATKQFQAENPGAEMRRDGDIVELPQSNLTAGLMAAKFNVGVETTLMQQAIIRGKNDLQYYLVSMMSPAPREGDLEQDPNVRAAVETFNAVVESADLIDQTQVQEDRDDRLFRTRSLFLDMTEQKLRATLQKEQWFRYIRGSKDIGYAYIVEETAHDLPHKGRQDVTTGPEGVLIGLRSRLMIDSGVQSDGESWLFASFDRKSESFSNISFTQDVKNNERLTKGELGISRSRIKPVPDAGLNIGSRRGFSDSEQYRLEVTKLDPRAAAAGAHAQFEPITRDLPPYYLPQAMSHLLPRLVSLREPKTYLFATWVSDPGDVALRYVDVGREAEVTLAGQRIRAVPVKDRVGLEGSVTIHYISPTGKYMGSRNEDSQITIVVSNAAELAKIWADANLTRPGAVDAK